MRLEGTKNRKEEKERYIQSLGGIVSNACGCRAEGLGFDSRPRWTQKTLADVGYLLTTSVSTGLSKDSGSIFLNTRYKVNSNTLHVGTGSRSVPNIRHSFLPETSIAPPVVCLRRSFLLLVTHGPLYDMINNTNRI